MKKLIAASAVLALTLGLIQIGHTADEPKTTIKDVMKTAMKGGLWKKCAAGMASEEEQAKLVTLFEALAASKPPKGDDASWNAKTGELLAAAKGISAKEAGASDRLKKAANCDACHSVHKKA